MKTYPHRLFVLAIISILGTACPANDNNSSENNLSDVGSDASDQGQQDDTGQTDMGPDTGDETGECVLLNAFPRTLPLDGDEARITWSFSCDQPIDPEALEIVAPRELTMELEIPTEGLCQPNTDGHTCTFSAFGLSSPSVESDIRFEMFELTYGPEKTLRTDIRWHHTASQLDTLFAFPIEKMDDSFVTGGLGETFYKHRRPFSKKLRAAYKERLRRVEMNIVPPDGGNSTSTAEVPAVWEDLMAQNTETMGSTDGNTTESLWWAYDGKAKRFIGAALAADDEGTETYNKVYDSQGVLEDATAPVSILDARAMRIQRPGTINAEESEGLTVFVVGLNAAGNVVFHIPFGEETTSREFTRGTFFGLDESRLSSKTFGFVKQLGNIEDFFTNPNNEYFLVWSALPNDTKDKLNVTIFPSFSADAPEAIVTELDTGFEVLDTYVSQSSPGSIIVLAHGVENQRAMYRLNYVTVTDPETGDETSSVTSHVELELPDDVDVRPSPCHNPKKDTPKKDGDWECKDPVLTCTGSDGICGQTDHFRTVGSWPWNWRDLKSIRSETTHSMILDWNDDGSLNSVFPLVLEKSSLDYKEGAPIIVSELNKGRATAVHTTSFSPESCANPEDCLVQVADSVLMGPGTKAPTFYIQGEDGLKKVRDGHGRISAQRANRGGRDDRKGGSRDRRRPKRVIAPVIPGTSTAATHVLMDLETTPEGSDTVNSVQLNITIKDKVIDPNLALFDVIPNLVDDEEELLLIFEPLVVPEGQNPEMVIVAIAGSEMDAALANPDQVATIDTLGDPLSIEVDNNGFGISSISLSLRNTSRLAPPSGGTLSTHKLSAAESKGLLIVYPSGKNGGLVVANLRKEGDSYVHTELDFAITPAGDSVIPRGRIARADHSFGRMVSSSKNGATFISARELSPGARVVDVLTRPYSTPLSDSVFAAASYEIGDFNRDGLDDLYVSADFSILAPSEMVSADDVVCPGCSIYFGDGLGGFLESSMDTRIGPWTTWTVNADLEPFFGIILAINNTKKSQHVALP